MLKILDKLLPLSILSDEVVDELKILQSDVNEDDSNISAHEFWKKKKCSNQRYLPVDTFLVYHGSADIKRAFSGSKNMPTENHTRISVEVPNAKHNVQSALKQYDDEVGTVPIMPELIKKANAANSVYKIFLADKKEKEEREG